MSGSFLPSLWSSTNHSLLGSRSRRCYANMCLGHRGHSRRPSAKRVAVLAKKLRANGTVVLNLCLREGMFRPNTVQNVHFRVGFWELSRITRIDPSGFMERAMGIEPTSEAWEASILPLYDAGSSL